LSSIWCHTEIDLNYKPNRQPKPLLISISVVEIIINLIKMNSPDFEQSKPLLQENPNKINLLEEAALIREARKGMISVNEESKESGLQSGGKKLT